MCGIAGFTRFHDPVGDESTLKKMGDSIAHRGPDAEGVYLEENIGLCHRRLSIIDLSEAGNQPMFSSDGNLIMVFNGEIYNFLELRKELEKQGYEFKTETDSEVILALYSFEGESCLKKLNGMFAIAIWDKARQELFMARDRLGKKPLCYYYDQRRLIFASEIKAILQIPSVPREIREDAVWDYFAYQYVPDSKSIFKNIHKLAAGHNLKADRNGVSIKKYWDVSFQSLSHKNEEDIAGELLELLDASTRQRMISDVPLGAFLSGGVDSSGIVALMAGNSTEPVVTCSIGFDSKKYDEIQYANQVARLCKTNHHELIVKENIVDKIEHIARFFDEPFADQSLVPTFFVSQMARKKVTVALAGDGGDENFAGYEKYRTDQIENKLRNAVPRPVRDALDFCFTSVFNNSDSRLLNRAGTLISAICRPPAEGFYRTNAFMSDSLWRRLATDDLKMRLNDYHPSALTLDYYHDANVEDHLSRVLYTDIKTYLVGDILVKVDRMSMANSLEVRAPFLDYRVVEYAASIPSRLKICRGNKKHIVKKAFSSLLPEDILYRKKMGFSVPLADWLRGELRSVCESKLLNANSGLANYFNMEEINSIWIEHQQKTRDYSSAIWSLLMFELWWNNYIS